MKRVFAAAFVALAGGLAAVGQPPDVAKVAEAERVAVIAKVRPAVAAVCFYGGKACGSGVVIDPDGYCLTNYHVVEPTGAVMQCGLADGELYDTVLVGQDKVGDVALVKLLPKTPGKPFPFVALGDSDKTKVGEWSLAMGNPFGLSLDFQPTVTFGLISATNRYQPPEGAGTLEYTDCIQTDTSINPGNSGGPLFNMRGELIGINGRIMFEKRVRINSGVGFAISINQIKNFLGHFRAGIDTDHATLGATVETLNEDGDLSRMVVKQILEESDAFRRGLQPNDQLIEFAGRPLTSTNQYKNILGIFPKEWRVPVAFRRENDRREVLVRLMGNLGPEKPQPKQPQPKGPNGPPQPPDPNKEKAKKSAAAKLYEAKKGYANYHFNVERQTALWEAFKKHGDFTSVSGPWAMSGNIELADRKGDVTITVGDAADGLTEAKITRGGIEDSVKPLKENLPVGEAQLPTGSGGLLVTLYQYRRLLTQGKAGFELGFAHAGHEPLYPPAEGKSLTARRVDCEVLRTKHGPYETKWYFSLADHTLLAAEAEVSKDEDPCEVYFGDYKVVDGRKLPGRLDVVFGNKKYATVTLKSHTLGPK